MSSTRFVRVAKCHLWSLFRQTFSTINEKCNKHRVVIAKIENEKKRTSGCYEKHICEIKSSRAHEKTLIQERKVNARDKFANHYREFKRFQRFPPFSQSAPPRFQFKRMRKRFSLATVFFSSFCLNTVFPTSPSFLVGLVSSETRIEKLVETEQRRCQKLPFSSLFLHFSHLLGDQCVQML